MNYEELERAYQMASKGAAAPDYIETNLAGLMVFAVCQPELRQDIEKFLEGTSGMPRETLVAITPQGISIVTDHDGNPLTFA